MSPYSYIDFVVTIECNLPIITTIDLTRGALKQMPKVSVSFVPDPSIKSITISFTGFKFIYKLAIYRISYQ